MRKLVEVLSVSKAFKKGIQNPITSFTDFALRGTAFNKKRNLKDNSSKIILNDITFSINSGESLGIVGTNGSGKSTLLKIISGIIQPDKGEIKKYGSIVPLLGVSGGLSLELTGRQNIYVYGTLLGLKRNELNEKINEIIDFAELEEWIDTPIKRYSKGMKSRLGFSIALSSKPDLLILDEVLAVGDKFFRGKCFRKLQEIKENGTTFLLVSHSQSNITKECKRALLINKGKIHYDGSPEEVFREYDLLSKNI